MHRLVRGCISLPPDTVGREDPSVYRRGWQHTHMHQVSPLGMALPQSASAAFPAPHPTPKLDRKPPHSDLAQMDLCRQAISAWSCHVWQVWVAMLNGLLTREASNIRLAFLNFVLKISRGEPTYRCCFLLWSS